MPRQHDWTGPRDGPAVRGGEQRGGKAVVGEEQRRGKVVVESRGKGRQWWRAEEIEIETERRSPVSRG